MAGRWYYRHEGAEYGPVALPQLTQLASSGQIHLTDWVREGESNPWRPVSNTPVVAAAVASRPAAPPARRPMPASSVPQPQPLPRAAVPVPRAAAPAKPPAPRPMARPTAAPVPVAAKPVAEDPALPHTRRSQDHSLALVVGLAVGGIALLAVLGLVIVSSMGGDTTEATPEQVAKKKPADVIDASAPGILSSAQLNMTKGISTWREVSKKGTLKGLISFEVKRVYWTDSVNLAPAIESTEVSSASPGLCIEMAITNISDRPLAYTSWNSQGRSGAWLVDADLKPVVGATGAQVKQQLAPKQTIVETLQFQTKSKDFRGLRMVLPYLAVDRSGQWGYVLNEAALRGEIAPPKASTNFAETPKPRPMASPAIQSKIAPMPEPTPEPAPVIIAVEDMPAPATEGNAPSTVDDGEPNEDIRDLIKKSVEKP